MTTTKRRHASGGRRVRARLVENQNDEFLANDGRPNRRTGFWKTPAAAISSASHPSQRKSAAPALEDGEMEHWVLATLFATGSEPRDVYINTSFVTKMERVDNHTEVEFSSGTQISVRELPHKLIGHKPDRVG
jgi:hypothetical protein